MDELTTRKFVKSTYKRSDMQILVRFYKKKLMNYKQANYEKYFIIPQKNKYKELTYEVLNHKGLFTNYKTKKDRANMN